MRIHLFEFEDLSWFPPVLRNAMTAYLAASWKMLPVGSAWAPLLGRALAATPVPRVIDLCSGSGGPLPEVLAALKQSQLEVIRTDLYPSSPDILAVDARRVPDHLKGVRTLFAAFHHFQPELARDILRDARHHNQPICVFEATRRHPVAILLTVIVPLLVLVLTPRIRPVRPLTLLFTYLIPILPLLIAWDGFVSHLRTYSLHELRSITAELSAPGYTWETGELSLPGVPFPLPYLIGLPGSPAMP
jgi:hypothetical protein